MTNYVEIYFYEGLINVANIIPVMFKVNISMWKRRLETNTKTHTQGGREHSRQNHVSSRKHGVHG